jgi:hypothetical protein
MFNIEIGRSDRVVHCVAGGDHWDRMFALCCRFQTLATPTGVSPSSAAEQKHHQQNDQYGLHAVPPLVKKKLD